MGWPKGKPRKPRELVTHALWVERRVRRHLPPGTKLRVEKHPERNLIEVLVGGEMTGIYGKIPIVEVERLRAQSEEGFHEVFFRDYLKPFLQEA